MRNLVPLKPSLWSRVKFAFWPKQVVRSQLNDSCGAGDFRPTFERTILRCAAVVGALWLPSLSFADVLPANGAETAPNFAEISVLDDRVLIKLEIGLDDLPYFVSEPEDGSDPAANLGERTGTTIKLFGDGVPLPPTIRLVEVRERIERGVTALTLPRRGPLPKKSASVVYVELDYFFISQPEQITISPPMKNAVLPAVSLGMLVDHKGVPVTDYRYLSRSETLNVDWSDPWYSGFVNPNITRHHKSALMSFISVEPREIRHEVIFRLRDLETWTDLNLGQSQILDAQDMREIKQEAAKIFAESNPLTVDGHKLTPTDMRVEQLSVGVAGLQLLGEPKVTERETALLGIIMTYPQAELPKGFELEWDLFTDRTATIPVQITDPVGGVPNRISQIDPTVAWTNYIVNWEDPIAQPITANSTFQLDLPIYAIAGAIAFLATLLFGFLASANDRKGWLTAATAIAVLTIVVRASTVTLTLPTIGAPDPDTVEIITAGLIENMGKSLVERRDEQFQNFLSPFVTEVGAASVGAEIQRGLRVSLPSGASATVNSVSDVTIDEILGTGRGQTQVLVNWNAIVSGGHWGHLHKRMVAYRALMDLEKEGLNWLVDDLTILETRMDPVAVTSGASS